MGSSDGRQGAASPQASATSSPLTAEDAERFASVLKPMWELDSAPQPAAPAGIAVPQPPSSRSQIAAPVVTVKPRQANGHLATAPFPAIIAPAPNPRDSSHEFDDLAQLPRGPSAAPASLTPTEPAPPEPLNAFAVEAHLPPRRQQISEPRASVEVDAPPQTVSAPDLGGAGSSGDFAASSAVAQASFGPTPEQLRARAARGQPTVMINKDDIAGFPRRRSRAPLLVGIGVAALLAAGAGLFLLNGGRAASAPPLASTVLSPANAPPGTVAAGASAGMAIPAPAPVDPPEPEPAQVASAAAPTPAPAPAPAAAATPAVVSAPVRPAAMALGAAPAVKAGAGPRPAAKPPKKSPGGIVRSSPF